MTDRAIRVSAQHHHTARAGRLEWMALGLAVAAVVFAAALGTSTRAQVPTVNVKSRAGDTLWELARKHPVSGLSTAETAELIARMNGVEPGTLQAGSTILVPAGEAMSTVAMR